jgi:hypothetical protein
MLLGDTVPVDFKGLPLCMGVLLCHPHIQMEILQGTCIKLQISSHSSLQQHFSTKRITVSKTQQIKIIARMYVL